MEDSEVRLARTGNHLTLITIVAAISVILLACSVAAFWVVFERHTSFSPTIIGIIEVVAIIGQASVLGITLFAATSARRKPLRSSNPPQIEHLRITAD